MPIANKKYIAADYIVCPQCQGNGRIGKSRTCPGCGGLGLGTFLYNAFFYWGPILSPALIDIGRFERRVNKIINASAFFIGIAGLLSLLWWGWQNSAFGATALLSFWRQQDLFLLLFWIGAGALMFSYYRLRQEESRCHRIVKFGYERAKKAPRLPDNWEELRKTRLIKKIDVAGGFSPKTMEIVEESYLLAQAAGHAVLEPMHVFLVSLRDDQVAALFARLNVDYAQTAKKLKEHLGSRPAGDKTTVLGPAIKEAFASAYLLANRLGEKKVEPMHLLIPMIERDETLFEILYEQEIDYEKIFNVITWFNINRRLYENYRRYRRSARFKPGSAMDRAYTAVATPFLSRFSVDLTYLAKWGKLPFCVAREAEIRKIFEHFESGHNGVLLVGPVGAGKRTVVNGVAERMVEEDVPPGLKDKRLLEIDVARLISGAAPAQAEERLLRMLDEIGRAGNIAVYIENIENIMGISAGGDESLDLSEVLVGAIERQSFYFLASATEQNYHKFLEERPLANILFKVEVDEPDKNRAVKMIASKIGGIEARYGVYFSYNAIEQVIALTGRYIHDRFLPAKAIDVLESVAVRVAKTKGENSLVTKEDIAAVISEATRIPMTKITEQESQALLSLEAKIHERMINQEEAVSAVAASLRRARTELREGKRPIANFLFLGPTGVGKTELAKTVAEVYFGREEYMTRLDMSEYQHADSVEKMIGDPDGTLGYLTEAVRKSPFSLILLDEFEKAHPDILNLFLQVMDDGRLTDGQGRTIDFTSSIVIATSNTGAHFIQEQIFAGAHIDEFKDRLINDHLIKTMRPELVNRFDGVIVFEPLSMEHVVEIAKLMLAKIKKRLNEKGIELSWEEEGVRKLAGLGFDPKFGARPLRRVLQNEIEDEIANKILAGELKRRDTAMIDGQAAVMVEKGQKI